MDNFSEYVIVECKRLNDLRKESACADKIQDIGFFVFVFIVLSVVILIVNL